MTMPPPPANQKAMVRTLLIAIGFMTTAIVVILMLMVTKILAPSEERDDAPRRVAYGGQVIDFTEAEDVDVVLPAGSKLLSSRLADGALVLEVETAEGDIVLYAAPLSGSGRPLRLRYREAE